MGMRRTVLAVEGTGTEEILKGFDLGIPGLGKLGGFFSWVYENGKGEREGGSDSRGEWNWLCFFGGGEGNGLYNSGTPN